MIIECINCSKKFDVNSDLIPKNGRNIQCGSCGHVWFYKKNDQNQENLIEVETQENINIFKPNVKSDANLSEHPKIKETVLKKRGSSAKSSELVKYKPKSNFTFGKFLSYILVVIVSFIGFILILDTFKTPLYKFFPNLEFFLFSLYETLKDIQLFIKDIA
tara:strand:- start:42 stop:524 length:483 start_codon:yes stop_codon:yes gene_type:complete